MNLLTVSLAANVLLIMGDAILVCLYIRSATEADRLERRLKCREMAG